MAIDDPVMLIRQVALATRASRALEVAAKLGIADFLAEGPKSSIDLATATQTDPGSLRRLLRALVAHGIFAEPSVGCFALNAAAELLRTDAPRSMRAGAMFLAGDTRLRLLMELLGSVRTGAPAFERVLGTDMFTHYKTHPEDAALFNGAMASFSAGMSPAVLEAYDFSASRRLVDVGGGTGRLLGDILAAHPAVAGTLFDLPNVIAGAPAVLASAGVTNRCNVVGGSFFDGVPSGGDMYLLKNVLHDWDDARTTTILAHTRAAMQAGGILLILERVMPERAEAGRAAESYLLDLEMLLATPGGRERSEPEFRVLLEATGFSLTRVMPTAAPISVVEARAADRA